MSKKLEYQSGRMILIKHLSRMKSYNWRKDLKLIVKNIKTNKKIYNFKGLKRRLCVIIIKVIRTNQIRYNLVKIIASKTKANRYLI